ncbi:MAG: hypothetical protein RIS76_3558, partial [Verrucomicrobiota bacterium]
MKNAAENFSPELLSYPETDGRSSRAATPEQMAASAKILDRIVALTSVPVPRSNETASAVEPVLTRVEVAVAGGQATAPQGTAASAADKRQPRILLIPLEFMAWKQAKSWSYTGNFAIEEGLEANGADCFVLPAWFEFPADSPDSLLKYARELCHGREFDQVWVWLTHNRYGDEFFCWLASLAPVRVGLTMESMEHSAEELSVFPHFRGRREFVAAQLRYMTHVLVADEIDAENFAATLPVKALWYPPMIPRRCVCDRIVRPTADFATFSGALYGSERAALLACKPLEGLLSMPVLPEQRTTVPQIFDNLHRNVLGELRKQRGCDPGLLAGYVEILRKVRRQLFDLWLEGFRLGFASVNLPSIFKGYAGRVAESMAAGMAVVSWDTPNRPRNRALFTADKEILLFDRKNPDELARHLRRLKADPSFAMEMATNARQKILLEHTAEIRTRKILDWLAAGTQPGSTTASPRQAPMSILMSSQPTKAKPAAAQPANQERERLIATIVSNHPGLYNAQTRAWADDVLRKAAAQAESTSRNAQSLASLRVTYLISSILGVTGGNQTLLRQADELQRRGHDVTIVTYTPKPNWFTFKMRVVQVPSGQAMAPHVPPSDVVISTYFINTHELLAVTAAVKVYYAQGDQFIFADTTLADSEENQRWRQLSRDSYLLPQVRFVPNSYNLAGAVEKMTGRKPDGLLPVCTDQTIFRPLQRSLPGSKVRILIVGPDVRGSSAEPLLFKGIQDIHDALHL